MSSRRQFLKQTAVLSLAPTIPAFLRTSCQAVDDDREKILIVVQLSGGNDGLNTLVPYKDDGYLANRTELRLAEDRLIKLNDTLALHWSMREMSEMFQDGKLAIVQGVGYPDPNRSHDVSMAVWHTARTDVELHRDLGWLGRGLDLLVQRPRVPSSVSTMTREVPQALQGRKSRTASIESLEEFKLPNGASSRNAETVNATPASTPPASTPPASTPLADFMRQSALDAYATVEQINSLKSSKHSALSRLNNPLASQFSVIADLIDADFGSRVYYAAQPGYDTHSRQLDEHGELLGTLSRSLNALMKDLETSGNADRVIVMCFSEFGRQVKENASVGTDHGTAGPVFLLGNSIKGGLHGRHPDLQHLINNAPQHTTDFRDVYANVLNNWLAVDPAKVLDGHTSTLRILES